jgi:ATP-dependent Clp protease ATP-binding subunit ClpC
MEAPAAFPRELTIDHLRHVLSGWTGIPRDRLGLSGNLQLDTAALRQGLQSRIFGQQAAIEVLVSALSRRLGLPERNARRPQWTAIAAGPSGVGKTETARVLAEYFFGDPRALIQIDCSELDQEHHLDRLVGSPPGYKGHGDGGQLTNALRRTKYCVILFDEVEKACDALLTRLLLPLLGEGVVHDMNSGQALDARDTVVFLTSNVGTNRREQQQVGFGAGQPADQDAGSQEQEIRTAIGDRFPKELLGRTDDVLIYRPLSDEALRLIWRREVEQFEQRLSRRGDRVRIEISPEAETLLIECSKERAKAQGARAVVRTFDKALVDRALRLLGAPSSVDRRLQVNHNAQGGLEFRVEATGRDPEGRTA